MIHVFIIATKNGFPFGRALVTYHTAEDAVLAYKAMLKDDLRISGRRISIGWSNTGNP